MLCVFHIVQLPKWLGYRLPSSPSLFMGIMAVSVPLHATCKNQSVFSLSVN